MFGVCVPRMVGMQQSVVLNLLCSRLCLCLSMASFGSKWHVVVASDRENISILSFFTSFGDMNWAQ